MKIYQVSCNVQSEIADEWQKLFMDKHLKDVFNTGCFVDYTFKKEQTIKNGMVTFVAEYHYEHQEDLDRYNKLYAADLKKDVQNLFKGKYACSRVLFEVIK